MAKAVLHIEMVILIYHSSGSNWRRCQQQSQIAEAFYKIAVMFTPWQWQRLHNDSNNSNYIMAAAIHTIVVLYYRGGHVVTFTNNGRRICTI